MTQTFTHITVHCSATKPSVYVDRDVIDRWHRARGWLMIGYHFVIKRDGTVQAGRPLGRVGAHVLNHNPGNLGICMAGGLNEQTGKAENNFTPEQWASLASLVNEHRRLHNIPIENILGHRDWPEVHKDCPCFDVRPWAQNLIKDSST